MIRGHQWAAGLAIATLVGSAFTGAASGQEPTERAPHHVVKAASQNRKAPRQKAKARLTSFKLADPSAPSVSAILPSKPLASTPTDVNGVTLQLYLAQRVQPNVVEVVFSVTGASSSDDQNEVQEYLSTNESNIVDSRGVLATSNVALLDPVGLKEYQPFMADPTNDATCLCSDTDLWLGNSPAPVYFAALLAAPPPSVQTVSFESGLGSIPNVTLTK